jgi:hypothetical protein
MYRRFIKDNNKMQEIRHKKEEKRKKLEAEGRLLGGHPKTQLAELKSGWRETIIGMMKEGASATEVRAETGIGRELWERLEEEEPEFREVAQLGRELSEAWWMNQARSNLYNGKFQTVLWYMNMKNRFGWKDKAEVDYTSGGKPIMPQIMIFGASDPLNRKIEQLKNAKEIPLQLDTGGSPA